MRAIERLKKEPNRVSEPHFQPPYRLGAWLIVGVGRHETNSTAGKVFAEDFGWRVPVESKPHSFYVVCANTGEKPDQWRVFAFAEGGVITWLLGRDKSADSLASLFTALRRCLETAPSIYNLREEA